MTPATRVDGAILDELPAPSALVTALVATLHDENISLGDVEDLVLRDPVIAAKVLSAANAAAYASHSPTTSVHAALLRLGVVRVRRLAVLASVFNVVPRSRALQTVFWRHSLAVAHAAESLANAVPHELDGDVVFLSALMHDVGWLVLATRYADRHRLARERARATDETLVVVERDVFGVDHADLGARLVLRWGFPSTLAGPIRSHHETADTLVERPAEAALMRLADQLGADDPAWALAEGSPGSPDAGALSLLGVEPPDVDALLGAARLEAQRSASLIEALL